MQFVALLIRQKLDDEGKVVRKQSILKPPEPTVETIDREAFLEENAKFIHESNLKFSDVEVVVGRPFSSVG